MSALWLPAGRVTFGDRHGNSDRGSPGHSGRGAEHILGHPIRTCDVELLEDRKTVAAVARPDGSQVVVKWSEWHQVLFAEWSALAIVDDLDLDPRIAPRLLGGDATAGVIVMERLLPGPSLATLLLGDNREAARRGLVALGRALGRLHAGTIGRSREFELRRSSLGPTQSVRYHVVRQLPRLLTRVNAWTKRVGIVPPPGWEDDLERLRQAMIRPGPFLSLIHGDPCPDNNRIYGDNAVLLDFQVAAVDHCLIDAAIFTVPFPNCWCVAGLDAADAEPALNAYREELSKGLPQVCDDKVWLPALTEASACWFLLHAVTDLASVLQADVVWGTATMAWRFVQWSNSFVGLAQHAGVLPALSDVADQVRNLVQVRWPDLAPAAYPALARPGQLSVERPKWWNPAP